MEKKAALLKLRHSSAFHDFVFMHRGNKYPVNTLLISAISPVVSKLIFCDSPSNVMELPPIEGPIDEFIGLVYGDSVRIDSINCRFFNFMAKALDIISLAEKTQEMIKQTNTLDNVVRFAEQLISCDLDASEEVNLIAGNFLNILENPYMKLCSAKLIQTIMKSPSFNYSGIPVINFLSSLIQSNRAKYSSLSSYVFSYANDQSTMFSVLNSTFDLNANHNAVITRLSATDCSLPQTSHILLPKPNHEFDGFFRYIEGLLGKLSKSTQFFELRSSPEYVSEKQSCSVEQILDPKNQDTYFNSLGSNEEFIQIRLMRGTLQLTHYSLMSWRDANKGSCPESWVVEGSLDGELWMEIDRVEHDRSLQAPSAVSLFKVKTNSPPLKQIRIKQLDTCSPRNKRLVLSALEFFGIYIE